jgi:putative ABC transport system permease protein
MTLTYVLMQNLRRNRLRSVLTAVAFALPMAVFVAAISMVMAMLKISQANAKELRLAVHHKTTVINMIPQGHRTKIEALDPERRRVRAVCGMRWFGGKIPNTQTVVQSLGADPDTFPIVYSDADMTPADVEGWNKDRQACVIGYGLAENQGWNVGSRITLVSSVPPYLSLEFHVVKIMPTPSRSQVLYLRRDYLSEALKEAGVENYASCNIFWIKCDSVEAMRSLQEEIDASFANSASETKSEDENAFAAGFMQAMGNIPGLMQAMAIVVVFIIALVAGNTMMMSFRERTKELAVFKAIGFPSHRVFGIVLGESVMLAVVGALMGVIPASILLAEFPVRRLGFLPIAALEISWKAVAVSLIIALLVGLSAGIWPAYQALRLNTVNALRRA